ncbi:hypothetical protein DY000_02039631 [Brassica cretica]|uniref:Uncharacterized protein n=1 Tax=Brassica cretica TaxID=69181 RepID=A0ABQ7B9G0_BRACR|nr:hypothetical protein DY000_02039631 [Brassica cretica]
MHVRIFKGRDPDPCYLLDVQSLPSPCDHLSFREFKSVMEGDAVSHYDEEVFAELELLGR